MKVKRGSYSKFITSAGEAGGQLGEYHTPSLPDKVNCSPAREKKMESTSIYGSNLYIILSILLQFSTFERLKINDVFSSVDGNMILSQIPTHADSGSSILSRAISNVHKFQQNQQFLSRMTGIFSLLQLGLKNFSSISRFCLQS